MPIIEIGVEQLKHAFEQLNPAERIKLVEDLEKATWQERFKQLLHRIDKRIKSRPVSEKAIDRICQRVRKKRYARSHN